MAGWKTIACAKCGAKNRVPEIVSADAWTCSTCKSSLGGPTNASSNTSKHFSYYQKYIQRVDVKSLIKANAVFEEAHGIVKEPTAQCLRCQVKLNGSSAVGLTNGKHVCEKCFESIRTVKYPEYYQAKYEEYLLGTEAQRIAQQEFEKELHRKYRIYSIQKIFGWSQALAALCSIAAFLMASSSVKVYGFAVAGSFWAVMGVLALILKDARKGCDGDLQEWELQNPPPSMPYLKEFCDPTAELSARDKVVLEIFDYWPGYPPFWNYLREIVLKRDGHRCQVTGCPSRLELHIHHQKPVSKGGPHTLENLISLCDFHHALEPEAGHERIWGNIKTRYFTLVREHTRSNRASPGKHEVSAHLRRLELVTAAELIGLSKTYGFSCPLCGSDRLTIYVNEKQNIVEVQCLQCEKSVEGPQELTEETGPRLAELLKPTRCVGKWRARWEMLSERTQISWGVWKGTRISKRRKEYHQKREADISKPVCPKCGSPMRLIEPPRGKRWKPFWGCTQFRVTGCKGSMKYKS